MWKVCFNHLSIHFVCIVYDIFCYYYHYLRCIFFLDPPRFSTNDFEEFAKPRVVKTNQKVAFKIPYIGREATKIQWFKEGEELTADANCRIETTEGYCRLSLNKLQRKDTGEIKIKIKNEFGTVEASTNLVVLGKLMKWTCLVLHMLFCCFFCG